jgi:hypothetical protein
MTAQRWRPGRLQERELFRKAYTALSIELEVTHCMTTEIVLNKCIEFGKNISDGAQRAMGHSEPYISREINNM